MNGYKEIRISDISGFKVGHAQDREGGSGCTAIICEEGACGALMSGSGPTVFGLYTAAEQAEYTLRKMKERHPDCFCGIYEFMNL